jgi:hypothetical protein
MLGLTLGLGELAATSGPFGVHPHPRYTTAAKRPSLFINRLTPRPRHPLRAAILSTTYPASSPTPPRSDETIVC